MADNYFIVYLNFCFSQRHYFQSRCIVAAHVMVSLVDPLIKSLRKSLPVMTSSQIVWRRYSLQSRCGRPAADAESQNLLLQGRPLML